MFFVLSSNSEEIQNWTTESDRFDPNPQEASTLQYFVCFVSSKAQDFSSNIFESWI